MTQAFVSVLRCKGVGINISKRVLRSRKRWKGISFVLGDVQQLTLKGQFDLIICGEVLEHLRNVDDFIARIRKILRDGGYLLLTLPNLASLFNRISLLLGWQPRGINPSRKILLNPLTKYDYNWGHMSMFTHRSIRKFLTLNGFRITKVKGTYGGHEGERQVRRFSDG
jgi:SAM-dependent methyltransferase